ncbi:hypothetical protein [Mesorhizobium sp. M7A.F.Ca.CA.004.04.1.1]|uniref:hypothetical protein n=1 Tax=Mesorhizobium sp. M7A.F.Ca.CA.004.04.1.1 TaxID=2496733 RepID=UPI0019D0CDF6|nr:hypothetical protein [Mesorhizobium sp. M7A.F.Ca.CA.004.04.1.1]
MLDNTVVNDAASLTVSATSNQTFDVLTTGIQAGAVAVGASYSDVTIGDDDDNTKEVLATIGTGSQIGQVDAVGAITVHADSTINVDSDTFALAAGLGALTFNFAFIDVQPNVEASIGSGANISATGLLTVEAWTLHDATGDIFALSVGALAAGTSLATVNVVPTVTASIGGNSTVHAGGIVMLSSHNYQGETATDRGAKAYAEASGGGLFSGQGSVPTARSNAVANTTIGAGGAFTITGDINIKSRVRNYAVANAEANSFGAAAVGASVAEAEANGQSNAAMNANIVSVTDIMIEALAVNGALAVAEAAGGGVLGALTINSAVATASPSSVSASIGNNTSIQSARNVRLKAQAQTEGDAKVVGISIGGIFGAGASDATTHVSPTVASSIGAGAVINATGDILVEASASPIPGVQPTYEIVDVDGTANTITVNGHGLVTGDTVEYDAGSGGAVIPGLNWPDPDDSAVNRQYSVINVVNAGVTDPNTLYFGSVFNAADIDPNTEIIEFAGGHNFLSGDAVRYYPGPDETVDSFGLTEGNLYYVLVIDGSHIKLVGTFDKAVNPQNYLKNFQPDDVAGNSITIAAHGFVNGTAVTYEAPDARTFVSRQVDVNSSSLNPDGSPIADANADDIRFFDDDGNALAHGFVEGEHVVYDVKNASGGTGLAIGGLVDGQTYRVHVVNSSTIQLKRNDAITEEVQFVRNAAGDRIIRTDGLNWADNGFAAGTLFIGGGGANSGTFTIASVSGSTLILTVANSVTAGTQTKTFDQPIIALAPNKGLSANPALNVGASDIHSLVNAKNLPIGGLEDGKTYYVRGVSGPGDNTFELWNAPSGGSQIALTPTAIAGPYGNHSLTALAVDISAAADSEQQLRIDINDSATSASPGQFLFGPGEVPLSEIAPQSGDGVSSAYAKGSGGGFVGVQINDADIISNPNVSATISATQITTVGNVTVSTSVTTNTSSYAVNGTGGFVAIGDADARSYQDIISAATISDNTRITAGKNFTLASASNAITSAASQSSAGGAVGLADPTTDVRIEYNTVSTIGSNAIVLAGQLAKATANASVDVTAKSTASGIGFGGDGDAITHVNIGSPDVDPDADQADAIVSLAANAVLSARRTSLAARVDNFHVFSGSDGRGAGFYGEGEAESTITARPDAQVRINAGADLTGWEGVDLITRYDNVDTHAKSYARSTGLFGFVDSDAHNDTDVSSEIFGAAGALVTAGPRDNSDVVLGHPDYPQEPGSSAEHLALFASTVNGPNIAQTDNADDSKRSLAAGGSSGSSPDDRPQSINFNSDVLILSGRSPELVIKQLVVGAEGQIDVAVEVSVNDTAGGGSATEGEGSTIQSNDIVVNNIVNPGPGDVVFDSNSMIGAGGTWTFRDTLQRVSIRNESDKDIIINNIDVVTDEQPLAWLNPSQSVTLTFKVVREVAPTLVEITDTGGHSDIYINGTIDNPIGTTSIVNTDGSVFATNDRGVTGSDGRQSLIRTHILNIRADENIGATGARVNIDIVDSAGLPLGIGFDTGRVAGLTNQVFLGVENRFYTGQLVRYDAVTTAIGGLTDGGYYYIIASPDGQSVKLATTLTNALAGTAIDLAPGGALTDLHSLISAETFTTDALGNISLDLKALLREAPAGGFYIVEIDRINAGNTADVLLQASIEQFGDGLSGGLLVKAPALPAGGQTYYNKFRPDEGAIPSLSRGVFATGNTEIASTYDFRGLDPATDLRTLPGLQAGSVVTGGDIIVAAANPAPSATTINVLGITEIAGNGDIDVLTNGYIALTEKTGDMRIERIRSNASDVLLYSPRRILDARNDNGDPTSIEADVSGRNITMAAGVGLFNPTHFQVAAEVLNPTLLDINSALGGIGEPGNFLEINVDNRNGAGGLGVLRAFDISADATLGIFLDEVVGDMHVHTVHTIRDVSLRTVAGSILDSRNNGLGDDLADVMGQTIDLDANGNGSIGAFTNDLEIDSSRGSSDDDVALEAGNNIYLAEAPEVPGGTAGNLRLVLAHTYDGDIRITVRETSVQGENLDLLHSGSARFGEDGTTFPTFQPDASRAIPHGQIFAEKGSVLLRVGDNVTLDSNSETLAAKSIDIYGDVSATNEVIHALVNLDFAFGTVMVLRGRIIANATVTPGNKTIGAPVGSATPTLTANPVTGPTVLTRIFGNTDVDTIQFGDTSGAGGTNTQGSAGYVFLGSKTRAYGSQNLDVNNVDGEDRFRVYYLQDTTTQTSPNMQTAAEHTLTLDGVSGTDLYEIYTLGSNNPGQGTAGTDFQRNYVINILDSGRPIDGVDELTIFGYDSSQNGLIGGNKPIDDIFLLRGANYLPHEAADRPGYVAMVYGQPKTYADTIEDNEPSNEVARINYDTALNGRITIEGQGGNDNFYSDDTTAIVSLQGGAGDDSFNIGQIFGTKRTGDAENGVTPFFGGNLLDQDVFPDMVATTRGWLSPGISAPMVAQGGTGNDEFRVYANQAELRLEGDDNNDLFIVRAFAIAAVANQDWNGDGTIDQDDLPAVTLDTNGDGVINFADADSTPDDYTDDVIVLDDFGVAKSIIGLGFSVARAPDIRAGGGEDEVQYNVNAPVSVDGGTGFDKLVILGTEFADDFAITDKGIFGAGLNVRYTTIEVVEVDGLEGDDEFFVQSTAFGVAYRVIGGLGSDTINVAGDVTEDIITRELEGASGAVDHLVTSGDPLYDGVLVDGFDYHVAGPQEGIVRIDETDGFTAVREGGPRNVDSYTVRLAVAPLAGQIVYVTISAARSPQQEEDGTLINPAPLPNGIGDTIWLSKLDPGAVGTDGEFQHVITINGVPTIINDRSIVLAFDSTNWNTAQNVYLYAPDDLRAEGDRVVVVQHSVISDTSGVAPALLAAAYPNGDPFDAADVRNVEVDLRDNDTPGIYVTEVTPGTNTEDGRSLVIEGNATTKLNDELLVQLAKAPDAGDTIVVKLYVNEFSDENIMIYDVDDPNGLDNRMFKGADGYWRITFDSGNWNDAVRVGIEARDDIPREDPHTAAIFFQLDQALTVDANHNYVFPNLRSGPGYVDIDVIDNDSAGAVVLESEGNTLLNGDGSDTDDYTIRLTKAPSTNVSVAVLTDGLADVVSVNGVAVTPGSGYSIIGGLRPTQIFDGNLVFSNEGGLGKITRSTGADLGSFVDEGFFVGQQIRIGNAGAGSGDYFITSIDADGKFFKVDRLLAATGAKDDVILSDLARDGEYTGNIRFEQVMEGLVPTYRITIAGLGDKDDGWLSFGFLEGQWIRVFDTADNLIGDFKIAIIRGDNDTKDTSIQITGTNVAQILPHLGATLNDVHVVRTAALAVFTPANYYQQQTVELRADTEYEVPITREGVKVFPVSGHYLSKLRGPLAVEGGVTGADRSLENGLKLPGEADDFLIAIGQQPPESQQIDVLNIFNDTSKEDVGGVMTATTLTGFNMADNLSLGLGVTGDPTFGESGFFPGGISFGRISVDQNGDFGTDSTKSTIEVVNLMLGEGNDKLVIEGTLNPAPPVQVTSTFDITPSGVNGGTIVRTGFDWKAMGFLVGQTVKIDNLPGVWTIVAINDALINPANPAEGADPNDNSILVLSGPTLASVADGPHTITAFDKDVITLNKSVDVATTTAGGIITRTDGGNWAGFAVGDFISIAEDFAQGEYQIVAIAGAVMRVIGGQLAPVSEAPRTINRINPVTNAVLQTVVAEVDVDPTYTGGIVTRHDNVKWAAEGYLAGHLVTMVDASGKRNFRIIEISEDGYSLTLEGAPLATQNSAVKSFYVQGQHGALTLVHGGGNMYLESTGPMNIAAGTGGQIIVTRQDGRDWSEDRYQVGQVIQLAGETYTRTILAIADATLPAPSNSALTWGDGSKLVLSAPNTRAGQPAGTVLALNTFNSYAERSLHVAEPRAITGTATVNITTNSLTRSVGSWLADGFYVGQKVQLSGFAGTFTIQALTASVITLQSVALTPKAGVAMTVSGVDITLDGGRRVGGDHIIVTGGAGPNSPLVIYGDTSQDGIWYSGQAHNVLGMEFGEKPFDPFPQLQDGENEDDEWVFPLANPYKLAGNDIIDASALFAGTLSANLPSVGLTIYGGAGNDTIYGSQAGDHLAGGSGDDLIIGNRGADHIYGDSGVNVNIFTRQLFIDTVDNSPLPSADPNADTNGTTIKPVKSSVRDLMNAGDDVIFGDGASHLGYGPSSVAAAGLLGDFDDIIFADHGVIEMFVDDPNFPSALKQRIQTTELALVTGIKSAELQNGGDDVVFGGLDRDVIVGGAGHDLLDGDQQDDRVFGDNVYLSRQGGAHGNLYNDTFSLRFQTLAGTLMYSRTDRPMPAGLGTVNADNSGLLLVDSIARRYRDPDGAPWWSEYSVDYAALHTFAFDEGAAGVGSFGNDYIAGSEGNDELLGQLGHDVVQGDGGIELAFAGTSHVGASRTSAGVTDPIGPLTVIASFTAATDGQDYIEGGGGDDQIFGGLGQDDLIGGSSSFFSLIDPNMRPDGDDYIFGGAGIEIDRNDDNLPNDGTLANSRFARDADSMIGDNGNIVRIVGVNHTDINPTGAAGQQLYVQFNYDVNDPARAGGERLVVRGIHLLDYTPGGPDFRPDLFSKTNPNNPAYRNEFGLWAKQDIGGHDEFHGETGDDTAYGGGGHDRIFGDAENDDLIGGWGNDWISGGTGEDGILGDDGRIFTSRNSATYGESLFGVLPLLATDPDTRTSQGDVLNEFISTPGQVQTETINVGGKMKKAVDLTPYNLTPNAQGGDNPLFDANVVDDIIFGGLGDDFIHGGSGDDAVGGGEALPDSYTQRFDAAGNVVGIVRTDFSRPWNPGDVLRFGPDSDPWNAPKPVQSRLGEFFLYDEYDPRRTIMFNADGSVWKTGAAPITRQYFLNLVDNEGPLVNGAIAFAPNGTPTAFAQRNTDGNDAVFGDLGNDWIVGGTGRDHIYGGWGNDLMNADDVLSTNNWLNDQPETHPMYEDRVFGGAGLDILIGNTGGDRLIDWVGEYNSYLVPFAPFGIATVSRQVPPQLFDFLYAQAFSDGVDITRTADTGSINGDDKYSHVHMFMGGVEGEIGLITQKDHGFWQDQTGGPTDPQAGNIPGGKRDVLRTADFNDGNAKVVAVDEGNFAVTSGKLTVQSASTWDQAAAVLYLDAYTPIYYELAATLTADKPTGGWKANSYIIFDYYSPTDFKYAGINISNDQIEMGYRDASGWHQLVKSNKPVQLKANQAYDVLLAVNGTNVSLTVAGVNWFSYTFAPRIVDGQPVALNKGLVGVGNSGSKGTVDNFRVQVLPPQITLDYAAEFNGPPTYPMSKTAAQGWTLSGGRLNAAASAGTNLLDVGPAIGADAYLELTAKLKTAGTAGIVFDYYGANDYKFVTLDVVGQKVLVGHVTSKGGTVIDQSFARTLSSTTDYDVQLTIRGAALSITVNGAFVGSYGFNAAIADGEFGLVTGNAGASFDRLQIRTNASAFSTSSNQLALASLGQAADTATAVGIDQAKAMLAQAVAIWSGSGQLDATQLAKLSNLDVQITDLPGSALAQSVFGAVMIDRNAAGQGWFVDLSPLDSSEFQLDASGHLTALPGGAADGRMDLLSVLIHEIGHQAGLDHDEGDAGVMSAELAAGERRLPEAGSAGPLTETQLFHDGLGVFVGAQEHGLLQSAGIARAEPIGEATTISSARASGGTAAAHSKSEADTSAKTDDIVLTGATSGLQASGQLNWVFDEASGTFVAAQGRQQDRPHDAAPDADQDDGDATSDDLNGLAEWSNRKGLLSRLSSLFGVR